MRKLLLVGLTFAMLLPATSFARGRIGVFVGPSFAPYGYGPYGYSYAPFGVGFGSYARPNAGQIKFDTKLKDAEVFINGSYAGTVGELKTLTMKSGDYDIQVRAAGRTSFEQQVYVIAGKTIKLRPDLNIAPAGNRS